MKKDASKPQHDRPKQEGDVLGISQSAGRLPGELKNRDQQVRGIELDTQVTDASSDGSPGYAPTDMGAG